MGDEPDLVIRASVEDLSNLKPEEALEKIYETTSELKVPSPESRSDAVEIMKSGYIVISKILRAFGEYYTKAEKMDVLKARGFKSFMESVAEFSESLSRVLETVPETRTYFDTFVVDTLRSDIASLIESGRDIGPELKTRVADLIEVFKNVPEIPDDLKQKSEYFSQFAEFSERVLDLLQVMTFIKKDVFSRWIRSSTRN